MEIEVYENILYQCYKVIKCDQKYIDIKIGNTILQQDKIFCYLEISIKEDNCSTGENKRRIVLGKQAFNFKRKIRVFYVSI